MKKALVLIICLSLCFSIPMDTKASENYGASNAEDLVDKNTGMIRKLFWSDEFNGNALNESNWTCEEGDMGLGSRVHYHASRDNVKVKNGLLDIVSQIQFDDNEIVRTNSTYSGFISSQEKFYFKYGEVEIKAKMATGRGVSSTSYLLGKNKVWPNCGEVDMFQYSNNTGLLTQAVITPRINNEDDIANETVWQRSMDRSKFHIFKMRWTDKKLDLFVDNLLIGTYNPQNYSSNPDPTKDIKAWPFNQPMYINILGSMYGNIAGERTPYGWTLVKENEDYNDYETHTYVDYVRAYTFTIDKTITNQINSKPELYRTYKKKKSKKLTIELFGDDWHNGLEFRIYKTKKNAKKNKKVLVEKKYNKPITKAKIKNKKLKNKKTLYVRFRTYKYLYNVKYYSKWSKPFKVKIKK